MTQQLPEFTGPSPPEDLFPCAWPAPSAPVSASRSVSLRNDEVFTKAADARGDSCTASPGPALPRVARGAHGKTVGISSNLATTSEESRNDELFTTPATARGDSCTASPGPALPMGGRGAHKEDVGISSDLATSSGSRNEEIGLSDLRRAQALLAVAAGKVRSTIISFRIFVHYAIRTVGGKIVEDIRRRSVENVQDVGRRSVQSFAENGHDSKLNKSISLLKYARNFDGFLSSWARFPVWDANAIAIPSRGPTHAQESCEQTQISVSAGKIATGLGKECEKATTGVGKESYGACCDCGGGLTLRLTVPATAVASVCASPVLKALVPHAQVMMQ
eukprot:gene20444-27233_t